VLTFRKIGAIIQIVAHYATIWSIRQRKEYAMNVPKLRGLMTEKQINVETLAELVSIDRSSMYRKLNNADKITIGEAMRIKQALKMSDELAIEIFLR